MRNTIVYFFITLFSLTLLPACSDDKPKKKKKKPKTTATSSQPKATEASAPADAGIPKEQLKKAEEILDAVDEDAIAALDAKKIYKMNCTVCHGFKGDMKLNGAKDLRKLKTTMVQRVAQVYFGKGLMTPFKNVLKEEEIVAVAKYVESLKKLK